MHFDACSTLCQLGCAAGDDKRISVHAYSGLTATIAKAALLVIARRDQTTNLSVHKHYPDR
eukprot:6209113-Pleurochrysis_carterae.AAC.1